MQKNGLNIFLENKKNRVINTRFETDKQGNYIMKDFIEQLQIEYQAILDKPILLVTETDFKNYYEAIAKIGSEIIDKANRMANYERNIRNAVSELEDLKDKKVSLMGLKNTTDDTDELMIINKLIKGLEK